MDLRDLAAGIGALADDTRRALYAYVAGQPGPVGREQAAAELGIAQHNVNFHLDRLVEEGLLEVEYRRLTGRSGPGAGRPSKLYRRSAREFAVSLPPRRYDLAGTILASAVERASHGVPLPQAVREAAHARGRAVGAEASAAAGEAGDGPATGDDPVGATTRLLAAQGYEPHADDDVVALANCPFDALAQEHTALVCGLNKDFLEGLAEGMGCAGVRVCLEPDPDHCCVKLRF
jgi:predicted ArsR family transcriptional regulator